MTEAAVPAKTEDRSATDRRLVVAGAVIVVMGAVIVGLVQLIRHSPCYGHRWSRAAGEGGPGIGPHGPAAREPGRAAGQRRG